MTTARIWRASIIHDGRSVRQPDCRLLAREHEIVVHPATASTSSTRQSKRPVMCRGTVVATIGPITHLGYRA
jgi:hypothetical protein